MEYSAMFKIYVRYLRKTEGIRQIVLMTEQKEGAYQVLLALSTELISLSKRYNAEKVVPSDAEKAYETPKTGYVNASFWLKFKNNNDTEQFYYDIEEYLACFLE